MIFGKRTFDRLKGAKMYLTGELDAMRPQALAQGDLPWRILRYQRVIDPDKVSYPIAKLSYTRPATFEKHLKYLSKECRVLPLDELARKILAKEDIADKTVAITFDGGWIDNFVYAYPLLLRYGIPATFYLPTAFIGSNNFFWQDKILFAMVIMKQAGVAFQHFDFFTEQEKELLLDISETGEISFQLILGVISILLFHPPEHRVVALTVLGNVAQQLGGDLPVEPAFMSWDDVRMMTSPLATFGTLGHGHLLYTEVSPASAKQDIEMSKQALQEHTDRTTGIFAFPEGIVPVRLLPTLDSLSIPVALGMADIPPPASQPGKPFLLGRLPIYEGENTTTDAFACNLWLTSPASK